MKDIAKAAKKDKDPKDSKESDDTISLNELNSLLAEPKMRLTGIYGEINEEKCSEAVGQNTMKFEYEKKKEEENK